MARTFRIPFFSCMLLSPALPLLNAQTLPGISSVPLCDPVVIDTTFSFSDTPASEQTVSMYFLNQGKSVCRLKGLPSPSFAVDGHSMSVRSCAFCTPSGESAPDWSARPENQVVLAPGGIAATDLNWNSTGYSCEWADWVSIFFDWRENSDSRTQTQFLFTPSAWPMHICSSVRSSGYRIVTDSPFGQEGQRPALRVSVQQHKVYSDEQATLHVELSDPPQSSENSNACASLFVVRRVPPESARFEPLPTLGRYQLDSFTPEQIREDRERAWPEWRRDRKRYCDMPAGATSAEADIAASDLANVTHIEWRNAPGPGASPEFRSVAVQFEVLDVESLEPNWGEQTEGIRAGISIDRNRFTVGEMVPLRVRWENVNAVDSLALGECGDPEPDVEIRDSQHTVLKTIPSAYADCDSHGVGPSEIPGGKPKHLLMELNTASLPIPAFTTPVAPILPGPGVYYLTSVWTTHVLEKAKPGTNDYSVAGPIYTTARSLPVRIEVVPRASP